MDAKKNLDEIAREDGRYLPAGLKFVLDGLAHTVRDVTPERRHISGQVLCQGLKELALQKWGRLAILVLGTMGIRTTRDFGEVVYLMIRHGWMSAQPTDSIDHFDNVFSFQTAFKDEFRF